MSTYFHPKSKKRKCDKYRIGMFSGKIVIGGNTICGKPNWGENGRVNGHVIVRQEPTGQLWSTAGQGAPAESETYSGQLTDGDQEMGLEEEWWAWQRWANWCRRVRPPRREEAGPTWSTHCPLLHRLVTALFGIFFMDNFCPSFGEGEA